MNIGTIILEKLKYEGKSQAWLARRLDIAKSSLNGKLKNNTLSAIEFIKIDALLDLNYEQIKEEVLEDMNNDLNIISNLIKDGNIGGYYPEWDLTFKDIDYRDVSETTFEDIAEQVLNGFTSGTIDEIEWSIEIK